MSTLEKINRYINCSIGRRFVFYIFPSLAIFTIIVIIISLIFAYNKLRDDYELSVLSKGRLLGEIVADSYKEGDLEQLNETINKLCVEQGFLYCGFKDAEGMVWGNYGSKMNLRRDRDNLFKLSREKLIIVDYYDDLMAISMPLYFNGQEPLGVLRVKAAYSSFVSQYYRTLVYLVILLLFFLIGVFIIVRILMSYITRPIEYLTALANRLAKGNYDDADDEESYSGEMKILADSFHKLSKEIMRSHRMIAENSSIAAIGSMSSHIAHDMRSPLSVLKSYIGLDPSKFSDEESQEYKQAAKRSVDKLLHMADDLVGYAKAGKVERSNYDVRKIICNEVMSETAKTAEEKNVMVDCQVEGACPELVEGALSAFIDPYRIGRVLVNLVNNAVQATQGSNGHINIHAKAENDGTLKIAVSDNGKGIDSESLRHVFDSFFTKGKKGGTGLGLAYCKQVVEAHGGKIDVKSEVGQGATFTITIPNCIVENGLKDEGERLKVKEEEIKLEKVLIADDDADIRAQWQRIVNNNGGTVVHTAGSVEEVMGDNSIDYSKIDSAVVDYEYNGYEKTGIDLIAHLKSKGVKRVYLCTGYFYDDRIVAMAKQAGAESIIPKPIVENSIPEFMN